MNEQYPILIIGGGIAGLSLAILCAGSNRKVILLEKGHYPRQKVCGEYISNESFDFLLKLGVPLNNLKLPQINRFVLSSLQGKSATTSLDPGGFGLSRYYLDHKLFELARESGVQILTDTKVLDIEKTGDLYLVKTHNEMTFKTKFVIGAYGRISGLNPKKKEQKEKFIGVKYHVGEGPADNVIEIHHFDGGYCGISKVENGAYNLCYLTKASGLKKYKGSIESFEEHVLKQNPLLRKRLEAKKLIEPVITSQIQFGIANSKNHLNIGDAAGFIPPITGNGISLALRSAKNMHQALEYYFKSGDEQALLNANQNYIHHYLKHRIQKGIFLQNLLFVKHKIFNRALIFSLMNIPGLMKSLTKQAVGESI